MTAARENDVIVAVIDACVLAGVLRRDLILTLGYTRLFLPKWSARILDEMQSAIMKITNGEADVVQQRAIIEESFSNALISNFEHLQDGLTLPDPNDRHVLAAAIAASADCIVTDNLKDFPQEALERHCLYAVSSDQFVAKLIEQNIPKSMDAMKDMRERKSRPAYDADSLIRYIRGQNLNATARVLENHIHLL